VLMGAQARKASAVMYPNWLNLVACIEFVRSVYKLPTLATPQTIVVLSNVTCIYSETYL
jgi:hypothetical protein